ncbi:hypothetical protein SAMN05444851_1067 [Aliiroseovarius sediminilitoris]|uniref:N-acetyltransferase domain-containing protein n=1 Tax=Aliiroseovarius sediminilitoris TaxID=1173584 RepID=A0A1I0NSL6_9RHOB|nr:hypothetical protein [Aliiroseovarius sediminilitoris]SEW04648.1 hypothetical protein SAMN05444851_1067 [Aliiroseovarius sediminilitoris]
MTIHDTFAGAQYVTAILDMASEHGLVIEMGSDFDLYESHINTHRAHQPIGAPFDPKRHEMNEHNGFWIVGWNEQGTLVHTQAMRRFNLGGLTLSDYLGQNFRDFPPVGLDLDMERSCYQPGPGARRISGKTCYHGELWVKGDDRYRGTGLPGLLARFALATCVLRWSPDHIFGFMPERHAFRGLAEREGYMHTDPSALAWYPKGSNAPLKGFMTYMSRDDLSHLISLCPRDFMMSQAA